VDVLRQPALYGNLYRLVEILQHPLSKLVLLGVIWAYLHHFCAGIRYLALDLHLGSSLAKARASSWWVMGVSLC